MYSSTTMKMKSANSFQPTKPSLFEQLLSPERSSTLLRAIETCEILSKKKGIHSVLAMNAAGFHYTNNDDTVCCDLCQLEVSQWTLDMKPFAIHAQLRPKCPFVLSILSGDIVSQPAAIHFTPSDADETSRGHYQQNLLMEVNKMKLIRERTFSHWPHQTSPSSAQMITAGFFACNVGDRVICLYCNLICQQWTPNTDDPYEVHKTLSPKCPYVVAMLEHEQAASSLSVNKIVNRSTSHSTVEHVWWFPYHAYTEQLCITELHQNLECNSLDEELLSCLIKDRLDLSISKNLVAEGFDLSIVKSCYENQFRLTGDDFIDDCDLRMACIIVEKQIKHINGKEENIIIPNVTMAKIHAEMSTPSQDVKSEPNAQAPTTTMFSFVHATAVEGVTSTYCSHSQQLC